jgi:hypothetical protein
MQARVINIAKENAMEANVLGKWQQNDTRIQALNDMLTDPSFTQASDAEKWAQLNALSGRSGMKEEDPLF